MSNWKLVLTPNSEELKALLCNERYDLDKVRLILSFVEQVIEDVKAGKDVSNFPLVADGLGILEEVTKVIETFNVWNIVPKEEPE